VEESGAQITADTLPALPVHSVHLQQLFQNLISNAIKYRSPERNPVVRISVKRESGQYLFSVQDNGIGIEPQYQERIFGIFKRLHTGEEYSGTGIGLAICQRIVERYRGRIWVDSEPGKGSTFVFSLVC
jgi:light-regulated signal transduction histidine kinase (bacteriophytochrome)